MVVYTVRKPGPNSDKEFQAYTELLDEIGIDLANAPRTLEPGTTNRWLHVWKNKPQAERFARALGARLRDPSWFVHEFELPHEELGPLAPLTILSTPLTGTREDGIALELEASSRARLMHHFPNARLMYAEVLQTADQFERHLDFDEVIRMLTGISDDALAGLGGIRIVTMNGDVVYEQLPSNVSQ